MFEEFTCPACARKKERGDTEKKALLNRLSRIEGQVRGLKRMIEENAYCPDVLTQSAAAAAALDAFNRELLSSHMHSCVASDIREGKDGTIDELMTIIGKLMR